MHVELKCRHVFIETLKGPLKCHQHAVNELPVVGCARLEPTVHRVVNRDVGIELSPAEVVMGSFLVEDDLSQATQAETPVDQAGIEPIQADFPQAFEHHLRSQDGFRQVVSLQGVFDERIVPLHQRGRLLV